jgi:hypothetical protein
MSTNTIAPVLPEGAGYGVVVGIGVGSLEPILLLPPYSGRANLS